MEEVFVFDGNQDWCEVELSNNENVPSPTFAVGENMLHNADHTYAWRGLDGEVIVDPVDVEVQTDPNDCNAPRKEASTLMNTTSQRTLSSEAEQEGAFRKAFIRSILASDTCHR
ncbi:hypothetical protein Pmani_010338 [Petrolisthes manimaculis]|uniref:Uncharacterized protein n=2 Tax=Petrolisthes manimaculis TaxID=1843537 RepID=A0AAE1Q3C7_9EUCA|nr:hypothetical protein Pmani_033098 [Petrolisthes manimaculis]KAK4314572.1 hypothetical protein Pmani_014147 [Petrolisthes manimaculis]KAK4318674.1 hypothetical protein Pmani_010338 [Petrolisthes manimaculis]